MPEFITNLDTTTQLIIALAIYVFFPQIWPKVKHLFSGLKLPDNNVNPKPRPNLDIEEDDSDDSVRLLTWLSLYRQCEELEDDKLQKALLSLPSLLIEKVEEENV